MASDKYVALTRLVTGDEPKLIANELGISYGTVIRYNKELKDAQEANKVNSLLAAEQGVLENMAQQAIAVVPEETQEIAEQEADKIINGVAGLKRLETDLQQTASAINTRIRLMTGTAENIADIHELTDSLCKLQSAFFGKGTQVNVQTNVTNNAGGETYGEFLSDAPGQT